MDLRDALRTTGAVRAFTDEPVPDAVLAAIVDDARFAPSGGNRQGWHVIVVRDQLKRRAVRDCYLDGWHEYVGHVLAGVVPFSPVASSDERASAAARKSDAVAVVAPGDFAARLDTVPVMLVVTVDLAVLAAVDRDLPRYTFCGGASVYPFVWSILLAARERGLGGVMTTVALRHEDVLRTTFDLPTTHAVACVLALGHPAVAPRRLTRRAVAAFCTIDSFGGEALSD